MTRVALLLAALLTGCALHSPKDMPHQEALSRALECRMIYPPSGSMSGMFAIFGLLSEWINEAQMKDCMEYYRFSDH